MEKVVAYFNISSHHYPGEIDENEDRYIRLTGLRDEI
jgi:hypothetical protein